MLDWFNKKLTTEWLTQQTESLPQYIEIVSKAFDTTPEDFKNRVSDGKILYRQMILKVIELWFYAFLWQVVLRQPAK